MPFRMSPWEMGIILTIILIVFGVGNCRKLVVLLAKGYERSVRESMAKKMRRYPSPNP